MSPEIQEHINLKLAQHQAKEKQRQQQQGLGKPIISVDFNGTRVVAVGNTVHYSPKWKTVFDFLGDYLRTKLGPEWGNAEIAKPLAERHPALIWYDHLCRLQQSTIKIPGQVHNSPMTGAAAAWFYLAYDLYCLEHNATLQEKLLTRLRNPDLFPGARYEVYVAATLSRAGFELEFENEDDRRSTHVEFTATYTPSGKKYSVEAKQRDAGTETTNSSQRFRIGRLLHRALRKAANYPRIVFLGIDVPDTFNADNEQMPAYLSRALSELRGFEGRNVNRRPLPPAYLIITNRPYIHNLDGPDTKCTALFEGFQIPEFKMDTGFAGPRAAHHARLAHADIHALAASMKQHSEIPTTFDGQAPELAFGEQTPRLVVGQKYMVPDADGTEHQGTLMNAVVMGSSAMGVYSLDSGQSVIATVPLTEAELAAYRRHPDTFFGVELKVGKSLKSPLDMFDFFMEGYRETPRERLLELMANSSDIEHLRTLERNELIEIYAERLTYNMMQASTPNATPNS